MNLSTECIIENVPKELKELKRWTTWGKHKDNMKAPFPAVGHEGLTFKDALASKVGVGIFLGDGLCGIDLDGCRDENGVVADWAEQIVEAFNSYTEVSPSQTGLKIFCLGSPTLERKQKMVGGEMGGKKSAIEAYTDGRYFTVTGKVYGQPRELRTIEDAVWTRLNNYLADKKADKKASTKKDGKRRVKSGERNNQLFTMAISMRKKDFPYDDVLAAVRSINKTSLNDPLEDEEVVGIVNNAFKSHSEIPWLFGRNGDILPCQENHILALELLGVTLRYDQFRDRKLIKIEKGKEKVLDDAEIRKLWFDIEKKWRFRAGKEYFWDLITWVAHKETFHPVQELLNSLKWDKKKRLETWLKDFGGAKVEHEEYLHWVSKGVLVAAVKRIFEPGCKFDEMVVLQGKQGCGKSMALKMMAMNEEWFSDSLPLGSDPQKVIEHTTGKWIIEAAELTETRGNQLENLKAFLSRGSDRSRMAYGREPIDRDRHFIIVGTTNDDEFLRDITGDRRYWPIEVLLFKLKELLKVREQLWAEAVELYKGGFDIRMPEKLWPFAAKIQESRKIMTSWMEDLEDCLNGKQGYFPASDLREWFMSRRWNDYISYQQVTKYVDKKMGFKRELRKVNESVIRVWWKDKRDTKIELYTRPTL